MKEFTTKFKEGFDKFKSFQTKVGFVTLAFIAAFAMIMTFTQNTVNKKQYRANANLEVEETASVNQPTDKIIISENKRNNGETTIDPNTKAMTKHMLAKAEESETTYLEPETQTNSTFVVNNKTKTSDSVKKSTTTRKEKVTKKAVTKISLCPGRGNSKRIVWKKLIKETKSELETTTVNNVTTEKVNETESYKLSDPITETVEESTTPVETPSFIN